MAWVFNIYSRNGGGWESLWETEEKAPIGTPQKVFSSEEVPLVLNPIGQKGGGAWG